jgi:hypothetical protein
MGLNPIHHRVDRARHNEEIVQVNEVRHDRPAGRIPQRNARAGRLVS